MTDEPFNITRWVTAYTDAGWKNGVARCGFVARGGVDPVWLRESGTARCDKSTTAELVAVLFAVRRVHAVFGPNIVDGLQGLFIRTDCDPVVRMLGHRTPTDPRFWEKQKEMTLSVAAGDTRRALVSLFGFMDEHQIRLDVKHVPAHGKARKRVQRWMNSLADDLGNMRGVDVER